MGGGLRASHVASVPAEEVEAGRQHLDATKFGAHYEPRHITLQLRPLRHVQTEHNATLVQLAPRLVWIHSDN